MALGVIGKKCGMTRIFTEDGESIPVSVIQVDNNRITQIKTMENDGYVAIQLTAGAMKASRVTKPMAGHFAKANTTAGQVSREFRVDETELSSFTLGSAVDASLFSAGQKVDVVGTSKGKGFAGTVKRWNFRTQDATHGNSLSHRVPGSIGQNQTPGRVFKGKKMAGQMGNKRVTVQNLEVVRIDQEKNLILVKGAVPGPKNGNVLVCPAVKSLPSVATAA